MLGRSVFSAAAFQRIKPKTLSAKEKEERLSELPPALRLPDQHPDHTLWPQPTHRFDRQRSHVLTSDLSSPGPSAGPPDGSITMMRTTGVGSLWLLLLTVNQHVVPAAPSEQTLMESRMVRAAGSRNLVTATGVDGSPRTAPSSVGTDPASGVDGSPRTAPSPVGTDPATGVDGSPRTAPSPVGTDPASGVDGSPRTAPSPVGTDPATGVDGSPRTAPSPVGTDPATGVDGSPRTAPSPVGTDPATATSGISGPLANDQDSSSGLGGPQTEKDGDEDGGVEDISAWLLVSNRLTVVLGPGTSSRPRSPWGTMMHWFTTSRTMSTALGSQTRPSDHQTFFSGYPSFSDFHRVGNGFFPKQRWPSTAERGAQSWTGSDSHSVVKDYDGNPAPGKGRADPSIHSSQFHEEQNDEGAGSAEERGMLAAARYPTPEAQTVLAPRQMERGSHGGASMVTRPQHGSRTVSRSTRQSSDRWTRPPHSPSSSSLMAALFHAHFRPQYDDYPTPLPQREGVSTHPVPQRSPPPRTLSQGSVFRRANTRAPTAAPRTRAPATKPRLQTTTQSGPPVPQPTPRAPLLGGSQGGTPGGAPGGDSVAKRTWEPTPASNTVCLQFSSVQHDVDCPRSRRRRRSPPSHQDLALLLQHLGGSPSSPFTAPTLQEAASRFRNLMPLGIPDVDEHIYLKFTAIQLEDLLAKHYAENSQSQSTKHVPRSENGSRHEADDLQLPVDFLHQMMPAKYVTFNSTLRRNRRSFDPGNNRTYACGSSVDCRHFDSSQCPDGQTEMGVDDNDCYTCRCAGGSSTTGGYCQHTGSQGSGVHSPRTRLCTQCQRLRHLGPDVFPSYLQEVLCHPPSAPCLDIGGALGPQGQCQESRVPISVLRRHPGRCMRIELTNGQSLVLDDWRLAQQMVRMGCQCMVDKRSPVAAILPSS